MTDLPRVTYSNIGVDFSPVHAHLDALIPSFERTVLGRDRTTSFATGESAVIVSPIDGKLSLGNFPKSTGSDVHAAVESARNSAKVWNRSTLDDRLSFAARWREALAGRKYDLGLAALYEIGKSRLEAVGEAEESVDMVEYYASELRSNNGFVRPMKELVANETAVSVMKPYGVFAVIAPFNFPVALPIGMISGALLTGNTVVYKPSPGCALTGLLLAETLAQAGLPEGVFNIVLGDGEVGRLLSTDAGIDGVAFTGSHKTGMSIFRHMATLPHAKPIIAEMGGKNPAYVTSSADLERAAQGVARSAFGLQGQKCSACSVVYVDEKVKSDFVDKLVKYASNMIVGDPRKSETFMGPVYGDATVASYKTALSEAERKGRVHAGGFASGDFAGNYINPTIVELDGPDRLTRDELFMPFLVVRSFNSLDQAIDEGNNIPYGLCAGIFTNDPAELKQFLDTAEAGVLYANRASGATTGAWPGAQPFSGWKGTGVSGKGGLGPYFLPQFLREQSQTIMTQ
ncbi:aldehyde dehydrogenase [Mesorhizobium sp. LSHC440B00]|uniref:aldehyde dehydrogenase family protein n=1 Tax=unclassified Mesorhizobium TaxID=325217 RepID=UPI0003CE2640|nr:MULTISPECIES: aldehyde dehydrogenase family protein [unclassified Mesorhizobium]ESX18026.1 aldehyde dehydrogenase [Mesorhizobium sp. LSHC440B00]ESX28574.1 aldehyde dehydrogenase [Mesorhizobium sp. LSHC440A00]